MMRYTAERSASHPPHTMDSTMSNGTFFETAFEGLKKDGVQPSMPLLLLVGGTDWRSLVTRAAQSTIRLDLQPSFWSQAAVLLEWAGALDSACGLEVAFDPPEPARQVPERNGVTRFNLNRYLDGKQYPHLALVGFRPGDVQQNPAAANIDGTKIREAALSPNRERIRFPLWNYLGGWARYLYDTSACPNPLDNNVPHPGASFCEYAFEAGGIDLNPNATGPQASPELFWAAAVHWAATQALAGVETHLYCREGERHVFTREALSPDLQSEFTP